MEGGCIGEKTLKNRVITNSYATQMDIKVFYLKMWSLNNVVNTLYLLV